MTEPKMMQKVKVVSGLLCGLIGRIIQIDHSWPAPYGIRYGMKTRWFYAEDLEPAAEDDRITQPGVKISQQKPIEERRFIIVDRRMTGDGTYTDGIIYY